MSLKGIVEEELSCEGSNLGCVCMLRTTSWYDARKFLRPTNIQLLLLSNFNTNLTALYRNKLYEKKSFLMNCFYLRSESLQTFSDKIGVPRKKKKGYTE